jgi:hypothetical protein
MQRGIGHGNGPVPGGEEELDVKAARHAKPADVRTYFGPVLRARREHFQKLRLALADTDHRRVLAVLRFLEAR